MNYNDGIIDYFDGQTIFKRLYKLPLTISQATPIDGNNFVTLLDFTFTAKSTPTDFYSVIHVEFRLLNEYVSGSNVDSFSVALRCSESPFSNFWLLDETMYRSNGTGDGNLRSGYNTHLKGGMRSISPNQYKFSAVVRRGLIPNGNVNADFKDPHSNITDNSNGYNLNTLYNGDIENTDDTIFFYKSCNIEVEQIIYSL